MLVPSIAYRFNDTFWTWQIQRGKELISEESKIYCDSDCKIQWSHDWKAYTNVLQKCEASMSCKRYNYDITCESILVEDVFTVWTICGIVWFVPVSGVSFLGDVSVVTLSASTEESLGSSVSTSFAVTDTSFDDTGVVVLFCGLSVALFVLSFDVSALGFKVDALVELMLRLPLEVVAGFIGTVVGALVWLSEFVNFTSDVVSFRVIISSSVVSAVSMVVAADMSLVSNVTSAVESKLSPKVESSSAAVISVTPVTSDIVEAKSSMAGVVVPWSRS